MNIVNASLQQGLERQSKDFSAVIKISLALNLAMFFVEIGFGFYANSMALITDSFDFLGDSLNYLVAIYVLSKSQKIQSFSAVIKAGFMLAFGLFILSSVVYKYEHSVAIPNSSLMIIISFLSLAVNLSVSVLLFKFRDGSSNQKSVWMCSRNDAINNVLVIIAGFLVAFFASRWPDLLVAIIMGALAISSSLVIFRQAFKEIYAKE